jgi:HlyD family secretion protein
LKKLLLVLLVLVAAAVVWAVLRRAEPPRINFARVKRETLVSTLPTNGKVEPVEWQAVRTETAGVVSRVSIAEGQSVTKGAEMAVLSDPSLEADIAAAEARASEARANVAAVEAGGKPADFTEIDNSLARARLDLEQQKKESETLERLAQKQAATPAEVEAAHEKIRQTQLAIQGLEKRRTSLVGKPDIAAASARLQDAEVALRLAKQKAALSVVRSPIAGVIYGLAVRPGAYLNVGDLIANVGRMERMRVRVYVDEPELGRVHEGQPVTITWQALPGRKWPGTVVQMPTSIEALGSRQVGQVLCTVENPGRELIPGTNVDAEIRTAVVDGALVIPREALRHDAGGDYVFVLKGDQIERRPVKPGASSVTEAQIAEGLAEGDAAALPSDTAIKPGDRVTPVQ